ncbi:DNA binding [Ascochyta rabiei]|uniref:DNA binding n=1 Tax=Didymella rabiei TaxID=5454 RepID=A0A163IHI8_DIDRA|nr:DNA binding [Ascochyta rabiei]
MSTFSHDRTSTAVDQAIDVTRRKQQPQQSRQLLSCTKCRERKVKCDRTKPCSACCARGAPKECHFVAEGGDYAPIQQSYELRKLRAENLRLKERLRTSRVSIEDDDSDQSSGSQPGDRTRASSIKRRAARQKRFQGLEWSDSIYFGSPGLANVIADVTVNLSPPNVQSLAHLTPRGPDMYTPETPASYPFATLFPAGPEQCIPQLLDILPARKELFEYLAVFEKRVYVCAFPHLPIELTKCEIERFLADAERNARMCPDMLALVFAAIALGAQHSVWDQSGEQWKAGLIDAEAQRGNVYVAASMQALRIASFMNRPSLLAIEALIMMGPFLTNSGRFLDAWTLFGTTVRLAQAIGLHRHPKYLDPAPPTQREWRPLGISGIGDCPPPHELTTDPRTLRFGEFTNHFTIMARQILSSDRLTNVKIDEFTDLLSGLLDTMPEALQFDESWLDEDKELPEWPLSVMAAEDRQTSRLCSSCRYEVLFLFSVREQNAKFAALTHCINTGPIAWAVSGTSILRSSMILLLDALETGNLTHMRKVEQAYIVFRELQDNDVHQLAGLAVEKLSWGLDQLRKNIEATGTRHSPEKIDSACAAQDEADRVTGTLHDTVMGNANMLLLEETGLQSYAHEHFAPFACVTTGSGSEATTPDQLKQELELQLHDKVDRLAYTKLESSDRNAPISNEPHSTLGSSQGSPFGRYCVPSSHEYYQLPSCDNSPTSPRTLAAPPSQHSRNDGVLSAKRRPSKQTRAPHSEHLESPRIATSNDGRPEHGTDTEDNVEPPERWTQPTLSPKQYQMSAAQLRHNSCPSVHQPATTPPLLRPTYSSPLVNKNHSFSNNGPYDMRTQWSAYPAAPTTDSLESGRLHPSMSGQGHLTPAFPHQSAQQQQRIYQYLHPKHATDPGVSGTDVLSVEQMTVDQSGWGG